MMMQRLKTAAMAAWMVLMAVSADCQTIRRVMVIAEPGGQHVAFTQRGLAWMREKAEELDFRLTEVSDCRTLQSGDIGHFDLIVQLNYPPYMWSEAAIGDFERYIDEGKGSWIGFHHASLLGEFDGYDMWQWFSDFMGGIRFQNYIAEKADGEVRVEVPDHPVMNGVDLRFVVREDEWYTYDRNPRSRVQVLASVDEATYQPASDIRMGDHPVVWTNAAKPSRNVYFQIGHSASLFDNPQFTRMFDNALRWGLHLPMTLSQQHSMEARQARKTVYRSELLTDQTLTLAMPVSTGRRARGSADDPDYAVFGTYDGRIPIADRNLEEWNRLSFDIRTDLDCGVANTNVVVENHPYGELGAHLVNLNGNGWQHISYEISELPRRCVSGIRFYTDLKGRNLSRQDSIHYYIKNVCLEQVDPEQTAGWEPARGNIAYSTTGYYADGTKQAIMAADEAAFSATDGGDKPAIAFLLTDALTDSVVYSGTAEYRQTTIGHYLVADFTSFCRQGCYRLHIGDSQTEPFAIGNRAMEGTEWLLLNFINAQRCGDPVPGIHGRCHTDVYAEHNGQRISYGGGWHDAGDLSQQTLQTADVAFALTEAYLSHQAASPQLAEAFRQEAQHGWQQVLKTRFGDGYRASSIGLLHWTDGISGTDDDICTVRTQDNAFDNFLYAAYEAYAAMAFHDDTLRRAAIDDYRFAEAKFAKDGFDRFPHQMEHTYNTSPATLMAAASWAATLLYRLTGEQHYADQAADRCRYLLDCQEQRASLAGYFYRDRDHQSIVHFIHQSRDHLPIQALIALCEALPQHAEHPRWEAAVRLHADYLRGLMSYTAPYGMVPSGIWQEREYNDSDGFRRLHLWAPADAHQRYDRQLHAGVSLGDGRYVRRFPIWFSIFNGNEAVLLSTGKSAALCGRYLNDRRLLDIAREQLYWTAGKNPFCQSLVYGAGHNYPSMDSFSSGEIMGEIPVGIRTVGDSDVPCFPQTNNACYKEVWLTSAGLWLSLSASL